MNEDLSLKIESRSNLFKLLLHRRFKFSILSRLYLSSTFSEILGNLFLSLLGVK